MEELGKEIQTGFCKALCFKKLSEQWIKCPIMGEFPKHFFVSWFKYHKKVTFKCHFTNCAGTYG